MRTETNQEPIVTALFRAYPGLSPSDVMARQADDFLALGRVTSFPVDVEGIASLLGVRRRVDDFPFAGRIYVEANGQVVMDLNLRDSDGRRRFTCAHELMHTVFPGFRQEFRYRADEMVGTFVRTRGHEEYLCDVGAAELLMPRALIGDAYSITGGLPAIEALADDAQVSLEAAGNRLTTLSDRPAAFLVLEIGHKPANRPALRKGNHVAERLRVRYAVAHDLPLYIPKYKSASEDSLFVAALSRPGLHRGESELPGCDGRGLFVLEAKEYPRQMGNSTVRRVLAVGLRPS